MAQTPKVISNIDNVNIFPADTNYPVLFDNNAGTFLFQQSNVATINTKKNHYLTSMNLVLANTPSLARSISISVEGSNNGTAYTAIISGYSIQNFGRNMTVPLPGVVAYKYYRITVNFGGYEGDKMKLATIELVGYADIIHLCLLKGDSTYYGYRDNAFFEIGGTVTESDFLNNGINRSSIASVPIGLINNISANHQSTKIVLFSEDSSPIDLTFNKMASAYNSTEKSYRGTGIIESEEEVLDSSRTQMIITAEHTLCTFEYSLDGGVTWSPAIAESVIDLSKQQGNRLKIKVNLPVDSARLTAISYAWV